MYRKILPVFLLIVLATTLASAGLNPFAKKKSKKDNNPIAGIDSKQPDKVLFDRALDALRKNRYDVARVTLQTLINTYPDSEYVARAKLAIGDAWYKEGGSSGLAQAEIEYKDFITFFPNMPEAAEAQLKVANIHYKQMEKADRDYTHAKRAEDEYKQLMQQFPDSKLVPQAKQHLREVQEVLAEREYRIGRFYYLRESYIAGIARLKTLTDTYPLFSKSESALFMLGDSYEHQINLTRASTRLPESAKGKVLQEFSDNAAHAYDRIVTRYPTSEEAELAKNKQLRVLSRTTASKYRETTSSLPEIARALGVRWVVEGGVGVQGSRAYVKLRAVDSLTDRKVWADVFDCDLSELVTVNARAADSIAAAIVAELPSSHSQH